MLQKGSSITWYDNQKIPNSANCTNGAIRVVSYGIYFFGDVLLLQGTCGWGLA